MTKVKDLVSCQSCKCFKVKRVDTVKGVLIKITEPDERTALTANKVENESKSCTTCREIKFAGLMQCTGNAHGIRFRVVQMKYRAFLDTVSLKYSFSQIA